ncbi:hypothetical protein M9H77_27287 [Catharanthus roseus]|uniref:Uncharacterized protein n=1 Tax=Catharanthus roseus TaxID=4058 RepID=A0ACC0ACG5_CATRO|nr:hypothetical protein M9H77_27287 [Catharanthus roseus]
MRFKVIAIVTFSIKDHKRVITIVNGISIVHRRFLTLRVDPLERRDVVPWRVWPNRYLRQTSDYALRWDGRHVESQEGLETKVGLRADLVGAPGSVAWFYVNGECGGDGIERS